LIPKTERAWTAHQFWDSFSVNQNNKYILLHAFSKHDKHPLKLVFISTYLENKRISNDIKFVSKCSMKVEWSRWLNGNDNEYDWSNGYIKVVDEQIWDTIEMKF
jgi:hypothetical protein